ncbi:MAG: AraC family transcriptional regulator [Myxococcaceae bacterium]
MLNGAQLDVVTSPGCEHSEATAKLNTAVLYLCPTDDVEVRFDGGRHLRGMQAPGTISIHPAGLRYVSRRLGKIGENRQYVALGLPASLMLSVTGNQRYEVLPAFGTVDPLSRQLIATLQRESKDGEGLDSLYAQSLMVALAAHLTRTHGRRVEGRIDGLRAYIAERLDQPLALDQLAAFAQCDVRTFTRWFKQELGVTPHQYVMHARIERAKSLLAKTKRPLGEIALECGFSSQSHLTTSFRRFTGQTPARFRVGL